MFRECVNVNSINAQEWDTSNVTNMTSMFEQCVELAILKLSANFIMSQNPNTTDIFYNCKLKTDRISVDFNGASVDIQNKINALLA